MNKLMSATFLRNIRQALTLSLALFIFLALSCTAKKEGRTKSAEREKIVTNQGLPGQPLSVVFDAGPAHNHPLMAVWIEDTSGRYLETLYVAQSIGTGIFDHGRAQGGRWEPGPVSRPAALPYWWHKYGHLPTTADPVPDAITGATPQAGFILETTAVAELPEAFHVLLEINQPWDWNEHWTNDKFPDDKEYKTSSQPALVYRARIDRQSEREEYTMKLAGHSHYSGADGTLFEDISTITTAVNIVGSVRVRLGNME